MNEDEMLKRVIVHSIDAAIWNAGIKLTNSEWCRFIEIFDTLAWVEGWTI